LARVLAVTVLCVSLAGQAFAAPVTGLQPTNENPVAAPGSPLTKVKIEQRLNEQLPLDAVFKDEAGATVRFGEYFGKRPVLLVFAYFECPMLCTLVLNGVVRVLNGVTLTPGKDFEVVVVSFDPTETPALAAKKKAVYLAEYAHPGTESGWHFLTGEEPEIKRLTDAAGFAYAYDPESKEYAHASAIYVATPQGKLARYFFGIEFPARDVKLALVEASSGKIGSLVDQLLLFCFHFDPTAGKYSLMILRLVRIAGVLTILAMGIGIILMKRRERKA
jgi:protein SCO1/2